MSKTVSIIFSVFYVICLSLAVIPLDGLTGGLPIKQVLAMFLLVLCFFYRTKHKKADWFVVLYVIFLFFNLYAGFSTGYGSDTLTFLISTYVVGLVLYWSTRLMVEKLNKTRQISIVLMALFMIDAIFTIGQFYQIPEFMLLPQVMGLELDELYLNSLDQALTMEGQNLFGLVGGVLNGYMLSAATILAWYPFTNKFKIVNVVLWAVCFLACFYTQERAGLFVAVVCTAFLLYMQLKNQKGLGWLLAVIIVSILVFFGGTIYEYITSMGRYGNMGMEDGGRTDFWSEGIRFIRDHPEGGRSLYYNTHSFMPHNLIINCFVAGGIIGGIIVLLIIFIQCIKVGNFILTRKLKTNWVPALYGLMYLSYTAQSLVHNQSLCYGHCMYFVLWGVFACYEEKKTTKLLVAKLKKNNKNSKDEYSYSSPPIPL